MSSASAVSISELRIRPASKSHRSSSFSSASFSSTVDSDLQEVLTVIETLLKTPNKSIYDPSVSGQIQYLKSKLVFLDEAGRHRLNERLRNKLCPAQSNLTPETVGAYICGCFLNSSAYGSLNSNCTALCAGSIFSSGPCTNTVLHWMRDPITGQAVSHHQSGKSSTCNVFIDQGFSASAEAKAAFLAQAGCRTVNYYDSTTNTPLLQDSNVGAPAFVAATPTAPTVAVTPAYPAPSQSTVTTSAVQNPSPGIATGAAGTVSQSYSAGGGVSLWVTFAIILFILIVLVVLFAISRYGYAHWY
jgi:hypothetical protein